MLKSTAGEFFESLERPLSSKEGVPEFERTRQLAYRLTSAMNELAWEVWDRSLLPELGAPDFDGPYGFAEPCIFVTFLQEQFDVERADEALEGVSELLERKGLFLAKVVYSAGDSSAEGAGVDAPEVENERPLHLKVRSLLSGLKFPRSG